VALNVGAWRQHQRDLDAGSDLADRARDRRGYRHAGRSARRRRIVSAGELTSDAGSQIGATRRGVLMRIGLGGLRPSHTVVFGETGSGKSWTPILLARLAIIGRGFGAIVIDPKCDPFMPASLANAATEAGKPFVVWAPSAQSIYNPLSRGSVTEVVDKLLAGEQYTEPHYMRLAQRFLQQ
jgi:DNA helicase HerA-like ATPase